MTDGKLHYSDRPTLFAQAERVEFDLLVIGGGITGAGIARDAALRGLSVLLVEARDFGSGTSSRSTKLIHGGLRYLAQGQIGLVREVANERTALQRIAPHLAEPSRFVIPARGMFDIAKLKAGLIAFEGLASVAKADRHQTWSLENLNEQEPLFKNNGLTRALVYTEYLTDDARLTLANIRSACAAGATVMNYAEVSSLIIEEGKAIGVEVQGTLPHEQLGARFRARKVVNATGPWVDSIRTLEDEGSSSNLQLTEGIHLVIGRDRLPISHTFILPTEDKRTIFVVPKGEFVYFGTTDVFYPQADYWPEVTTNDVTYLCDIVAKFFSIPKLTAADIVSVWSGLRPLIAEEGKKPSEISRKDEVWTGPAGVISIAGGKLTAYRKMAERVVTQVQAELSKRTSDCQTAQQPLVGGDQSVDVVLQHESLKALEPARAKSLAQRYGSEAPLVAKLGGDVAAEVTHAVKAEGALRLEDYWMRRSSRALFDTRSGLPILDEAAQTMGSLLGWSNSRQAEEVAACRTINEQMRVTLKSI